jgi:CheY-like chemotaxis protein
VTDNGVGMPDTVLEHVFEPFFTTKEAGKGTGLGLATVHGIVKQHAGWVQVSSAVGKGTTFRIFLPAASPPETAARGEAVARQLPRGRATLLLVEDKLAVRKAIAEPLRNLGYTVVEASNGPEAVVLWERSGKTYNLLFTDMVMPGGVSGLDLARRLRAEDRNLPVIIASGYSQELSSEIEPLGGRVCFLAKPFSVEDLADTVSRLLRS